MATIVGTIIKNQNRLRCPQNILDRAARVLGGEYKPKRIKHHKHKDKFDVFKLDVGPNFRLVSKDLKEWELLSHREYDRYLGFTTR